MDRADRPAVTVRSDLAVMARARRSPSQAHSEGPAGRAERTAGQELVALDERIGVLRQELAVAQRGLLDAQLAEASSRWWGRRPAQAQAVGAYQVVDELGQQLKTAVAQRQELATLRAARQPARLGDRVDYSEPGELYRLMSRSWESRTEHSGHELEPDFGLDMGL